MNNYTKVLLGVAGSFLTDKIFKSLGLSKGKRTLASSASVITPSFLALPKKDALYISSGALLMSSINYALAKDSFEIVENPKTIKNLAQESNISLSLPKNSKAIVDKYTIGSNGEIESLYRTYLKGKQEDTSVGDWYPASTIKYLAAIGAAKRLSDLGVSDSSVQIKFKDKNGKSSYTKTFEQLLHSALQKSDNIDYNRLVQLAGHKILHQDVLAEYPSIALNRPYLKDRWQDLTGSREFISPEIVVGGKHTLPSSQNLPKRVCPERSSCASLKDLNDTFTRLFLGDKFNINEGLYRALKENLRGPKGRGSNLLKKILSKTQGINFETFDKPGFAINFYSDVIALVDKNSNTVYIISGEGYGTRDILNSLGLAIGSLIKAKKI
jgi:hypothetical protein